MNCAFLVRSWPQARIYTLRLKATYYGMTIL